MRKKAVGTPVKVLQEAEAYTVSVATKDGSTFTGTLESVNDFLDCFVSNAEQVDKKGNVHKHNYVLLKGKNVYFVSMPEILEHSASVKNQNNYLKLKKKRK